MCNLVGQLAAGIAQCMIPAGKDCWPRNKFAHFFGSSSHWPPEMWNSSQEASARPEYANTERKVNLPSPDCAMQPWWRERSGQGWPDSSTGNWKKVSRWDAWWNWVIVEVINSAWKTWMQDWATYQHACGWGLSSVGRTSMKNSFMHATTVR